MKNEQKKLKISMVGTENSGKTKFCEYVENNNQDIDFSNYQTSTGAKYITKVIIYKNIHYHLDVRESPGKERYDSLSRILYRNDDIFFLFIIVKFHSKEQMIYFN